MRPVGRRANGQVAAGLGVEQEHESKHEGQRSLLDLPKLLPDAQVDFL